MKRNLVMLVLAMTGWFFQAALGAVSFAAEPPRISKEELQAMIGNPDLVIIDDRTGSDWTASEFKIKGAVREDPNKMEAWMDKYPKDKTLVFY